MSRDQAAFLLTGLCLVLGLGVSARAQGAQAFKYSPEAGRCVDDHGRQGLNPLDRAAVFAPPDVVEKDAAGKVRRVVFKNRSGECADFSGIDFDALLRKPEFGAGYLELDGWNLDGAVLAGARISFYSGRLSLRGAELTGISAGYDMFTVDFDRFTRGLDGCGLSDGQGHPFPAGTCYWKR
jgi:hypothetical protein